MDEKRQIQKELFEEFGGLNKKGPIKSILGSRPKRNLILSYEQLIFVCIALIISLLLAYSVGVEKGKGIDRKKSGLYNKSFKTEPASITIVRSEKAQPNQPFAGKDLSNAVVKVAKADKNTAPIYTIQIASYVSKALAEKKIPQLADKGFKPFLLSRGKYFIVCIGEFANKKAASVELKRLDKSFSGCYIINK
jgi:septal ring-binding cell division protein DamX